jgi:hypothetical protein
MSSQDFKLRVAEDKPATDQPAKPEKTTDIAKPNKPLPTVRIAFAKQLDILRAYAAASGPTSKMVVAKDVADIVQMSASTLPLASPFFVDCKLLYRSEGQGMTPASELLEYAHAYEWNKETAAHKLAGPLGKMWFWEALQPRLSFQELTDDQAITILAEKCTAAPEYKSQLRLILEYLDAAGLIKREGGQVRMVKSQQPIAAAQPAPGPEKAVAHAEVKPASPQRSSVSTNFAQSNLGGVQFDVSVRVDMSEFAGWQPARISAFFNGIAQVLSAKGMIEQESSKE